MIFVVDFDLLALQSGARYSIKKGISCLGIEPRESVALAARDNGIETRIIRDCGGRLPSMGGIHHGPRASEHEVFPKLFATKISAFNF